MWKAKPEKWRKVKPKKKSAKGGKRKYEGEKERVAVICKRACSEEVEDLSGEDGEHGVACLLCSYCENRTPHCTRNIFLACGSRLSRRLKVKQMMCPF